MVCGTPKETVDFYDAYRNAGGRAGGGYCAYGADPGDIGAATGLGIPELWAAIERASA